MLLIAYMCPCSLEINISSSSFLHFWREDSRKSQDLAWPACSVPRNANQTQQTVSSDGCKVPAPNAGFLLASMPSYCRFKPIECSYSESVPVSVPQDKIRGSAIHARDSAKLIEPSNRTSLGQKATVGGAVACADCNGYC